MSFTLLQAPHEAVQALVHALRLDSCPLSESHFEILRAAVWGMADSAKRAHVSRVLGGTLPTWQLMSAKADVGVETLRSDLRGALTMLDDVGDLVELSGGYWIPAPTRLVKLPDGDGYLLVGGVPSAYLELNEGVVQFHGPHRRLANLPTELSALPVEDLKTWAGLPDLPLQDWARGVLDSFERHPYTPTSGDQFEFYLPASVKPGVPQFFRWFDNAGDMTGTLLARRRRLYGAREYRLVDLRSGRIIRSCELENIDVRRLMYAFDLAAKNPTRTQRLGTESQHDWLFKSAIPRAEQRTFAAFGTVKIPDGRHFERRWTFLRNEGLALRMLGDLGIVLGH